MIEDSADDAELICNEIEQGGYKLKRKRVDTAPALNKALTKHEWDLVISDFSMPGFSALEALDIVKQQEPDIPFILVSGTIGEEAAVKIMKAGAHDYVMKDKLSRLVPAVNRELKEADIRRRNKAAEEKLGKNASALLMAHQELRSSLQRQKMLNEALQESEERFRELTETIEEVFWLTDWGTNQVLYISPAYETVFGQSCQSLYDDSKSWSKHIHPDYKDKIVEAYAKNATKGNYEVEYPLIRPDRRTVWVREMAFPIKDKKGKVIRMAGYSVDVTKRKKAEEKLQLSNDILHEVGTLVIVTNDQGNITYCAPSVKKVLGYKPEELLGNKWWEKTFSDKVKI